MQKEPVYLLALFPVTEEFIFEICRFCVSLLMRTRKFNLSIKWDLEVPFGV
jgi:hypothetical protein